jgi:hypothetical protein
MRQVGSPTPAIGRRINSYEYRCDIDISSRGPDDRRPGRLRLVVFPQILGETGREPLFVGLPDVNLELPGTDVLDGCIVTLEYRPANANPTAEPRR